MEMEGEILPKANHLREWHLYALAFFQVSLSHRERYRTVASSFFHGSWEDSIDILWEILVMVHNSWGIHYLPLTVVQLE
jgi:hypothetical protein